MSEKVKRSFELVLMAIALLTAMAGFAKGYFVTPVKLEQVERTQVDHQLQLDALKHARLIDFGMLQRIDERTSQTQKDVTEIKARMR